MIYNRPFTYFLIAGLIFTSIGCERTDDCGTYEAAMLVNLTGLDGCTWVIQLKVDGTRLEVTNLGEFVSSPVHNQSICVKYRFRSDLGSICMVGPFVEIIELRLP